MRGSSLLAAGVVATASTSSADPQLRPVRATPRTEIAVRAVSSSIPMPTCFARVVEPPPLVLRDWSLAPSRDSRGTLAAVIDDVHRRSGFAVVLASDDPLLGWMGTPELVTPEQRRWSALFDPVATYAVGRVAVFANAGVRTGQPRSSVNAALGAWTLAGVVASF